MKLKIRNLGVIEKADINIKPLTLFVGPNNAGKTWLAYTFAGILGRYGWSRYTSAYIAGEAKDTYRRLDEATEQILTKGNARFDLVQFIEEAGEKYVNNVARHAKRWMREYMRTGLISFDSMEFHIELSEIKEEAKAEVLKYALNTLEEIGQEKRKSPLNILKEEGSSEMYLYVAAEKTSSEEPPAKVIKDLVVVNVFTALHRALFTDKPIFPTERTTYITYPFSGRGELNKKSLSKKEGPLDEEGVRILNAPISLFLSMIETTFWMDALDREEREEEAKNNEAISTYIRLAQLLEGQILKGSVDFSTPEPGPQRDILFQSTNDVTVEIPIASSMVKELSSLVLYLRYLAEPGDWLIIDEPEMNLHPAAQMQVIEFLAMLVNAGLRVLITTHSTYIVDHLTNLMEAYKHKNQEAIVEMFLLEQREAFISQENISAYLVEDRTVKDILSSEGVIDWKTFSDVTKFAERIKFELLGE